MSPELQEAILVVVQLLPYVLLVWFALGVVLLFQALSGKGVKLNVTGTTTTTTTSADNFYTKQAAKETAEGNIKVAQIKLQIENSQRERAGLLPIRE